MAHVWSLITADVTLALLAATVQQSVAATGTASVQVLEPGTTACSAATTPRVATVSSVFHCLWVQLWGVGPAGPAIPSVGETAMCVSPGKS